jgi:DNA end-binding protein Ku
VPNSRRNAKTSARSERKSPNPVRQFWSGTIAFGLVTVPVELLPAQHRGRASLREVDRDGTPLRRRYFCPEHKRIVPPSEIIRGYEIEEGRYVTVTDEELGALEPERSREIDLRRFVDRQEISPLFFERAYYLTPTGDSTKAYRLLATVLEATQRVGIATFVMRDRDYLIAISGEHGILRGETLRFEHEIRSQDEIAFPKSPRGVRPLEAKFERIIERRSARQLDPDELEDPFVKRLAELVQKKAKQRIDVVELSEDAEVVEPNGDDEAADGEDLLDTIRRSLGGQRTTPEKTPKAAAGSNGHFSRNGRSGVPNAKPKPSASKANTNRATAPTPDRRRTRGTTKKSERRN